MIHNPFSKNYKPQLSALTPSSRQTMLNGRSPEECKALILANAKNAIHITTQQESDESKRKAGRRINHI